MTVPSPTAPSLLTRLASTLRGEVASPVLQGLRRAGAPVHDDLAACERRRTELALGGGDVWDCDPGTASQLLSTWNAFALQALGEAMIDADDAASPRTRGYLPPVTAEQCARWFGEVEFWASRARRAAADPTYDVLTELALPAPLPAFVEVEPCPPSHLAAMLAAGRTLRTHAELAVFDLERSVGDSPAQDRTAQLGRLKGLAAEAASAIGHAERLVGPDAPRELHERAERALEHGLRSYYLLGQLLAVPALLEQPARATANAPARTRHPLPWEQGFDPWVLTDPPSVERWQRDPQARQAIGVLWASDPDPAATLAGLADIEGALEQGSVVRGDAPGGVVGHYFCCPWSSVYTVRRPVRVLGTLLQPGQQFAYDVSAEELPEGRPFVRRLVTGPFSPTDSIDYCDPTAGGHGDG